MSQERYHYEAAFAGLLRARRVPFVGVDEARRTLLPPGTGPAELKSFDFVVYGPATNALVDIKGRRMNGRALQCWATREDVESLLAWERLFGPGFVGLLVFMYLSDSQPEDGRFDDTFASGNSWYCLRSVRVRDYAQRMQTRSAAWGTVHLPSRSFESLSSGRSLWSRHEKRPA